MRKAPDLRLRFGAKPLSESLTRELSDFLDSLAQRRVLTRWFPSAYEPEVHLLGGAEVLDLVHAHFEADSLASFLWDELRARGETRLSADVVSLAAQNDLFYSALSSTDEVWDVWHNVAILHGRRNGPSEASRRIAPVRIGNVVTLATRGEARVLKDYQRANAAFGRGLERLWRAGKLLHGRRRVLPFLALWHWNRWGFDVARRARLYEGMIAALDPRAAMRCAV